MLIGYAGVSTQEQNLDPKKIELEKGGCEKVYEDQAYGRQTECPGLVKSLEMIRAGDTLIMWKLERLGRRLKHLISLVEELEVKDIRFRRRIQVSLIQ